MKATSEYLNQRPRSLLEAQADRDLAQARHVLRHLRVHGLPLEPQPAVEVVKRRDAQDRGLAGLPIVGPR